MSEIVVKRCDFCGVNKAVRTTIREAAACMGQYSTCNYCEAIDPRHAFILATLSPEDKLIMLRRWWKGKKSNETLSKMYPTIDWSTEDEGDLDGTGVDLNKWWKYLKPTKEKRKWLSSIKEKKL